MHRYVFIAVILDFLMGFGCARGAGGNLPSKTKVRLKVKVLIVVSAEWGDSPAQWNGEGKRWASHLPLDRRINAPGLGIPLFCTNQGVCVLVTGVGPIETAASMMAAGLAAQIDLSQAYILVNGTAGVNPQAATVGSVAWIRSVVNADMCSEVDPRELPEGFPHSRFSLFCHTPWCEPWPEPPGTLGTNQALLSKALELTAGIGLADEQPLQELRARYTSFKEASSPPQVLSCDAIAGATYWHGAVLGDWASQWVDHWLKGDGQYCMTDAEDFAILLTAQRMASDGLLDGSRVLVLRAASNFDRQPPDTSVIESLNTIAGMGIAHENLYRVAAPVVDNIVEHWSEWCSGVPGGHGNTSH